MSEQFTVEITPQMAVLIPIVVAILQVLKTMTWYEKAKQWTPFVAIAVASALAYLTKVPDPILPSIIIALIACGGYDALKAKTNNTGLPK